MASKLAEALAKWQAHYSDAPEPPSAGCPPPTRLGQDQYRCRACGLVWDTDETRPQCANGGNTK